MTPVDLALTSIFLVLRAVLSVHPNVLHGALCLCLSGSAMQLCCMALLLCLIGNAMQLHAEQGKARPGNLLIVVIKSHVMLQVQSMLLQLAKDPSQDVVDTALEHLLPALLKCMADTDLLHTSLLPAILTDIRASIERYRCSSDAGTLDATICLHARHGTVSKAQHNAGATMSLPCFTPKGLGSYFHFATLLKCHLTASNQPCRLTEACKTALILLPLCNPLITN